MSGIIRFVLLNCLALHSSYRLFSRWGENRVSRAIAGTVLVYVSQIVLIESVLGALGILGLSNVFLCVVALWLASWLLPGKGAPEAGKASWSVGRLSSFLIDNKILMTAVTLCLIFYGGRLVRAIVTIPLEGDSIGAHLPIAADYLKNGTIFSGNIMFWYYPCNSELLTLWFLLPMMSDVLANLQNWPLLAAALCAIYGIARSLSIGKKWAVYGCLLYASIQPTWGFLGSQKNDIFIAAFFLATLLFLIDFRLSGRRSNLIWASLCAGLVFGGKYVGPLYCVALLPAYLILDRSRFGTRMKRLVFPGLAGVFALGGIWYLRNWILTGSPFYPLGLTLFGHAIFTPQPPIRFFYDLKKTIILYHWSNPEALRLLIRSFAVCGRALGLVSIPLLVTAFLTKKKTSGGAIFSAARWSMLLAFLVLLVTPLGAENTEGTLNQLRMGFTPARYALSFFGLAAVFLSLYAERAARWGKGRLVEAALLTLIVVSFCFSRSLVPKVLGSLIVSGLLVYWVSGKRGRLRGVLEASLGHLRQWLLLALAALVFLGPLLVAYKVRIRAARYDRLIEITRGYRTGIHAWAADIRGKRIAVTGIRCFGFFGPFLENDVTNTLSWEDDTAWPRQLKDFGADYLIIGRAFTKDFPPPDAYAGEHGELFKRVYEDVFIRAYEVIRPEGKNE